MSDSFLREWAGGGEGMDTVPSRRDIRMSYCLWRLQSKSLADWILGCNVGNKLKPGRIVLAVQASDNRCEFGLIPPSRFSSTIQLLNLT
jgi:hypothetical protein